MGSILAMVRHARDSSLDRSDTGTERARFLLSMQYQLILFAGAIAFSLALLSPWPAIVGAAAELLYLALHFGESWMRRRRRRVAAADRLRAWATKAEEEERELDAGYLARVAALGKQATELGALAAERGMNAAVLGRESHLGGLVQAFTRLCVLHQRLNRLIAAAPIAPITEEIARLERDLKQETDAAVRASLTEAVQLGQRRLRQQGQLESRRRALGLKMGTLETSFEFLRSHILGGSTESEVLVEIDELLAGANAPLTSVTHTGTFSPLKGDQSSRPTPPSSRHTVLGLGDP
jgi:hypothetical protein